jgi:ankyrin repeat protein
MNFKLQIMSSMLAAVICANSLHGMERPPLPPSNNPHQEKPFEDVIRNAEKRVTKNKRKAQEDLENNEELQAAKTNKRLYDAAQFGNMRHVLRALNDGAYIYTHPLNVEQAEAAADRGQATEAQMSAGFTPLHQAAGNGHHAVVKTLLEAGAHVDIRDTQYDSTPLHQIAMTRDVAHKAQMLIVSLLIEHGADVNAVNGIGWTALDHAVDSNRVELVRYLLDHNAKPRICNPLFDAIRSNRLPMVHVFLEHGYGIEAESDYFHYGRGTALWMAARFGRLEIVQELLNRGANIDYANAEGETPLAVAHRMNHDDVVDLLERHRAVQGTSQRTTRSGKSLVGALSLFHL